MIISKRAAAILLIVFGVLTIVGVLYWTFAPTLKRVVVQTPDAIVEPVPTQNIPVSTGDVSVAATRPEAVTNEDQEQLVLRQRALQLAARQGSYTNADDFASLQTMHLDVTTPVKAFYAEEQQRLQQVHPLSTGIWTQTLRALSSRVTSSGALSGATEAVVVVQAQQIVEADGQPAAISYQEVTFLFAREQGRWIVSRVTSRDLEL